MSDHDTPPTDRTSTAPTIDGYPHPGRDHPQSVVGSGEAGPCGRMMLVTGTGPELTGETRDLLRRRLRLAATVPTVAISLREMMRRLAESL